MKKTVLILSLLVVGILAYTCREPERSADFEDLLQFTIYDYLVENSDQFSNFLSILEAGELDKTLKAYNPDGTGYTLFLPDNEAINNFINKDVQISSLNDILNNQEYAKQFARYHVINQGVRSDNFPFGAFSEPTLSEDFLTVSFIIESDSSFYKINNQAGISFRDIEVSNGYIHIIETALSPINFTTYDWLGFQPDFTIFKKAVDIAGFESVLSQNIKQSDTIQPLTLLVESDDVYRDFGISSIEDLIDKVSPDNENYTSLSNPLHNFVGYHILEGNLFIDDFEGVNTNYTTKSEVPLIIDGTTNDFAINRGKQIFDTIIVDTDTSYVDFIGFLYDESNVLSQTGAVHLIDKLMTQKAPSRAVRTFQFFEEPVFNQFRQKAGTYLVEEDINTSILEWTGVDLYFVELGDLETSAWSADYLEMDGDFEISYKIPRIVPGKYEIYLGAEMLNNQNAVVEVQVDNNKLGGFIDLGTGGTQNSPFNQVLVGVVDFNSYQSHTIKIVSLIPGKFAWDYIRFEPI